MIYTTQQLIEILEQEMYATWRGERVLLSSEHRINNPVLAKAINLEKANKVFAYQDFRHQIHEYQQKNQVSGLIWRTCTYRGKSVRFPERHNQLIAVEGDKETLMQSKHFILDFWRDMTQEMNFWLVVHQRRPLNQDTLSELIEQCEWVELDAARTELYLGLCWGNPMEYQYQWAKPQSGCHRVIAAIHEPSSIKI